MNDFDDTIRNGLTEATDGAGDIGASELAARLRTRRAASAPDEPGSEPARPNRRWLAAAAAALVLVAGMVGVGVWSSGGENQEVDVVTDDNTAPPPPSTGFDGWEPGWHEIDLGPVSAITAVSMAWFRDRVIVAGGTFYGDDGQPSGEWTGGVWAFDPADQSWSTLPAPPFESVSLVAAGDQLVAASGPLQLLGSRLDAPIRWATWAPGDEAWTDRGGVPVAPQLQTAGTGPTGPDGELLVWTGKRVLDLSRGAILDPASGDAETLPMPDDIVSYTHLVQATPVWTGDLVALSSWSRLPGLAWDADGQRLDDIPGPVNSEQNLVTPAAAAAVDGRLVLTAQGDAAGGQVASYNATTGRWTELPSVPGATEPWCPYSSATVGTELVVQACPIFGFNNDPIWPELSVLRGDTWGRIPRPPSVASGSERLLGADDALFVWSDDDTINNDEAPFRWATVWIPDPSQKLPASSASRANDATTGTAAAPPTIQTPCRLDELPDLGPALPPQLDVGPRVGVGGDPTNAETCSRFWGTSDSPGIHLTQTPGPSPFPITEPAENGDFIWGDIHEDYGVDYRGPDPWSARAYGITRPEFDAFVRTLTDDPVRYGDPDG